MRNKKYFHLVALLIAIMFFLESKLIIVIVFIFIYIIAINYPNILYYLANIKYSQNKLQQANKYFDKVNTCFYTPIKLRISYVYFLLVQGQVDKSEVIIKSILNEQMNDNDKLDFSLNYSLVMWKKNNLDKAIDILEKTYIDNKSTLIYQNLGYFLLLKGDYNKALEFNLEAIDYNDSDLGIIDNLAQNYYYLEEYNKAIELFNKVILKKPTFANPYYYYALTLIKTNNKEQAIEILKQGLDCNFTFLSIITKEDLEMKIVELETV